MSDLYHELGEATPIDVLPARIEAARTVGEQVVLGDKSTANHSG